MRQKSSVMQLTQFVPKALTSDTKQTESTENDSTQSSEKKAPPPGMASLLDDLSGLMPMDLSDPEE